MEVPSLPLKALSLLFTGVQDHAHSTHYGYMGLGDQEDYRELCRYVRGNTIYSSGICGNLSIKGNVDKTFLLCENYNDARTKHEYM